MPSITRRSLLASAALAPFARSFLASGSDWRFSGATISPRERFRQLHFPNVTLTTHEGKAVRFYDDLLKDKVVTINFMYEGAEASWRAGRSGHLHVLPYYRPQP